MLAPSHTEFCEKINLCINEEFQNQKAWNEKRKFDKNLEYDVTFLVGNEAIQGEVPAVGFLLARISPVLMKCYNDRRQTQENITLRVPSVFEFSSIESIVEFSFGSKPNITSENFFNVRAAVVYYCIEPFLQVLDDCIQRIMRNEELFCWVLHSAFEFKAADVVEKCVELFKSELDQRKVINSSSFSCLDFEPDLQCLLGSGCLRIEPSELVALLIDWGNQKDVPAECAKNEPSNVSVDSFIVQELQKMKSWKINSEEDELNAGTLDYDVTLIVGKDLTVPAVGFLLAKVSGVLEKQLQDATQHHLIGDRICICVPCQFEFSSVQSLVQFSFGLKPKPTKDNLFVMLAIASYYDVQPLYEILEGLLFSIMRNEEHFCWALHSAFAVKDDGLVEKCLLLFKHKLNHRKVFSSHSFLSLDLDPDLYILLRLPELSIDSCEILKYLKAWAECKEDTEKTLAAVLSTFMLNRFLNQQLEQEKVYEQLCPEEAYIKQNLNHDVTFVIGKDSKQIHAVGFLLARMSPILESYLEKQDQESLHGETLCIHVPSEFELSSMQCIVNFSFGFKPVVTDQNFFNLRAAALHYNIHPLVKIVENVLFRTMQNEEHFCWVLHSACTLMDYEVVEKCMHMFKSQLDHKKVIVSNSFCYLDFELELCFLQKTQEMRIKPADLLNRLEGR